MSGNILMQMLALGYIDSLRAGRQIVRNSFALSFCEPGNRSGWDEAYAHLLRLMSQPSSC